MKKLNYQVDSKIGREFFLTFWTKILVRHPCGLKYRIIPTMKFLLLVYFKEQAFTEFSDCEAHFNETNFMALHYFLSWVESDVPNPAPYLTKLIFNNL